MYLLCLWLPFIRDVLKYLWQMKLSPGFLSLMLVIFTYLSTILVLELIARLYEKKSESKRSFLSANEKDIFTHSSKKQ